MTSRRAARVAIRWSARRSGRSPLVSGHVEIGAQRAPHGTRIDAGLDRLRGSTATQSGQHMVDQHRRRPNRAELHLDEFVEFGQPHGTNLPSAAESLAAHRHRVCHLEHALPRALRRLPE